MIELFEGVPGSGKSYYAVAERFLAAVRDGRRIYLYVDGIYLDRLAAFTGIARAELDRQITVWQDPLEVLAMHGMVEPQSLVIIDEAQTVFRAMERVDRALLRWLETHRHHGVDVLLCCQDYRQVSSSVTRLVEATIKFRKLALVGLQRHSQGKVRGNPEDEEIIRTFTFKYHAAVYAYYSSYSAAAIREEKRRHSVLKSARVATGIAAGIFAVGLFIWKPWTSLEAAAQSHPVQKATAPGGPAKSLVPALPLGLPGLASIGETVSPALPARPLVRIQGVFGVVEESEEKQVWRYLLSTGETLTASEIAGRYGIAVSEIRSGGFPRLVGEGVVYESGGD
jgi:zona occludens toxin